MTLAEVPIGTQVRIQQLRSAPDIAARLRELGLRENVVVHCLLKGHGNFICAVRTSRIGLNRRIASMIDVAFPDET